MCGRQQRVALSILMLGAAAVCSACCMPEHSLESTAPPAAATRTSTDAASLAHSAPPESKPSAIAPPKAPEPQRTEAAGIASVAQLGQQASATLASIEGIVVDDAGARLANASVFAQRNDVESREQTHQFPLSDAEGRFRFHSLPAGTYRLWAHPQGAWVDNEAAPPERTTVEVAAGEERAELVVRYREPAGLSIAGVIVDPNEAPIPAADTFFSYKEAAPHVHAQTTSDREGRFAIGGLPPGKYQLSYYARGLVRFQEFEAAAGDWNVKIVAYPCATATGVVVDARSGAPITDFDLYHTFGDRTSISERDWAEARRVRDSEGRFTEREIELGANVIAVRAPGYRSAVVTWHQERVTQPKDDLRFELEAGRRIRGRVVDRKGEPVADARIAEGAREDKDEVLVDGAARSGPNGSFTLTGAARDPALLSCGHEHFKLANVAVPPEAGGQEITIVLDSETMVSGEVTFNGKPAGNCMVYLTQGVRGTVSYRSSGTSTDTSGRYDIDDVRPGDHRLLVVYSLPGVQEAQVVRNLTIAEGERVVSDVKLASHGGEVAGRLLGDRRWHGDLEISLSMDTSIGTENFICLPLNWDLYWLRGVPVGEGTLHVFGTGILFGERRMSIPIRIGEEAAVRKDIELVTPPGILGTITGIENAYTASLTFLPLDGAARGARAAVFGEYTVSAMKWFWLPAPGPGKYGIGIQVVDAGPQRKPGGGTSYTREVSRTAETTVTVAEDGEFTEVQIVVPPNE